MTCSTLHRRVGQQSGTKGDMMLVCSGKDEWGKERGREKMDEGVKQSTSCLLFHPGASAHGKGSNALNVHFALMRDYDMVKRNKYEIFVATSGARIPFFTRQLMFGGTITSSPFCHQPGMVSVD